MAPRLSESADGPTPTTFALRAEHKELQSKYLELKESLKEAKDAVNNKASEILQVIDEANEETPLFDKDDEASEE